MGTSETCKTTETQLARIAWLSASDRHKQFTCLMHHFNEASLSACYSQLDGRKAVGADGVSKADYGVNLVNNLNALVTRMKRLAYRPGPVRRVLIPKTGKPGAMRPLGISNVEDKLVQCVMHKILESIYEPLFLDCSYGFRPGRGCHDAVQALHQYLFHHEVVTVIDVDLACFFDTIDHNTLLEMLSEKIKDARFLRYVTRMFNAGVRMEDGRVADIEGVPQGSVCSPILANIFAHYVIDLWFEETVKRHCRSEVALFRYADDIVICCGNERDAQRIREALARRLARFGLSLNMEKTKLVPFARQGTNRHRAFDFLGFTFYWGKSRRGIVIPKVKTCGKRLRAKLRVVSQWLRKVHSRMPLSGIWNLFRAKLLGHIQYYGVSFNVRAVHTFIHQSVRMMYKWLNRRSQSRSFTWESFRLFIQLNPLPRVVIYHPLF